MLDELKKNGIENINSFEEFWKHSEGFIKGQLETYEAMVMYFSKFLSVEKINSLISYELLRELEIKGKIVSDDVLTFLKYITDAGVEISVATNTLTDNLSNQLSSMGLDKYFSAKNSFSAPNKSLMKPNPYVYIKALEYLQKLHPSSLKIIGVDDKPSGIKSLFDAGIENRVAIHSNPTVTVKEFIDAGATHLVKNLPDLYDPKMNNINLTPFRMATKSHSELSENKEV